MIGLPVAMARLGRDQRGVALIEFAFVVPILLLLFVGGYQLSDAVFAYRKVTATTRTIADLTTQNTTLSDTDIETILNASQQILTPYNISATRMRVSQVTVNGSGVARVDWSQPKNMADITDGSIFVIPAAYRRNDTTIVVAEVFYDYVPSFGSSIVGSITLKDRIDMNPRKSVKIARTS